MTPSKEELLVLALSVDAAPAPRDEDRSTPASFGLRAERALEDVSRSIQESTNQIVPDRLRVKMELSYGANVFGSWIFSAADLNLPLAPEALIELEERVAGLRPVINSIAARSTWALTDRLSTRTLDFLDKVRQRLSADPSLPLAISKSLSQTVDSLATEQQTIWLKLSQPSGFLPLLPWERMLRPALGRPIARLARRLTQGMSGMTAQDLILICTGIDAAPVADPESVVAICRSMLDSCPPPKRAVVHLFADALHRPLIADALAKHGLQAIRHGDPESGRGIVLYDSPTEEQLGGGDSKASSSEHTQSIWDRPWARWIKTSMAGRAADVIHIVCTAHFSHAQAVLHFSPDPGKAPVALGRVGRWLSKEEKVRSRYVDAQLGCDLANELGVWAIVLSAPTQASLRCQRALMYQLSALLPALVAVHDVVSDPGAAACAPLYRMLTGGAWQLATFTHPALVVQCDPSDFQPDVSEAWLKNSLGKGFIDAYEAVKAEMNRDAATPTWAAVMQRNIEQSASIQLSDTPLTERDKAARDGAASALTEAMAILTKHMGPNIQ
jgi:hypothetical protein